MNYGTLAIFQDITNDEVAAMIHCFKMSRAQEEPCKTICNYGEY